MTAFHLPEHWPQPADPVRAARVAQQLPRPRRPRDAAVIACLGGNSAYLSALALRESTVFEALLRSGPDRIVGEALARLLALDPGLPTAAVAAELRQAKRQVALAAAVADIGGIWDLGQVTTALSRLAEDALGAAVRHLLRRAADRRELVLADPADPARASGFVVLGMGKLGASELNYSSDIDLVVLYDPTAHPGHEDLQRVFTRMAGDLARLMQDRDEGGYVFRTDLRLRPDPAATPLAVSLPSAIAYYESSGQTWERAAMIKARPVAGDLACGADFLAAIRPFVWRRHLDFAAIEDIRAMKRRIDRRDGGTAVGGASLLGRDLKLGHGGIREIEFLAQTMQLVWGGRAAELRDPTTTGALARLAEGSYMPAGLAGDLAHSYRLLRRIEHRLQMQDDRQTHSLPASEAGFEGFARFMDQPAGVFAATICAALQHTRAAFEEWFAEPVHAGGVTPAAGRDAGLADHLRALGFAEPGRAAEIVARWQQRTLRALRSDRAQVLLGEMLPTLLAAAADQRDPMLTLSRFDTLLARQSAGVHLLSLLVRNPPLLGRIAFVLSTAPSLAEHLTLVPAALEGLLVPETGQQAPRLLSLLDSAMGNAGGVEEAVRHARPLVRGEEFRLALAQMDRRLDVDDAGLSRAALADCVMRRVLEQVQRDHQARFGRVPGGGLVIVALGKAGSRDMMAGSDLDLMLVYDHPESVAESTLPDPIAKGAAPRLRRRPLPASRSYIRLAHSLIAALSAPGAEGPLYALDMRLRPSGSKGPVAVSLSAFRRYHNERSWTWERMALCRARIVAGPARLRRQVHGAIVVAIGQPGAAMDVLFADAWAMRERITAELPPRGPWDIKLIEGGLLEVEFIAQAMQLAAHDPRMRHPTTRLALRRLARGGVLARADAAMLIDAERFWRATQSMLRILYGTSLPRTFAEMTPAALDALLRGVARPDGAMIGMDDLRERMAQVSGDVRALFLRLLAAPAQPGGT